MTGSRSGFYAALSLIIICTASVHADRLDNEAKRLQGAWQVTEMVENGRVMSTTDIQHHLPGGGMIDIIDYTVLFKSPVNGVRSTRSFRLDPASYPKRIMILDGDKVTGVGIYQLDQGKFVICVGAPNATPPTEFSAPEQSGRTLMVMQTRQEGQGQLNQPSPTTLSLPAPPTVARSVPSPTSTLNTAQTIPPQPPVPSPSPNVAARVLSDADVTRMLVGVWRLNDGEGVVDLSFSSNNSFSSYRHTETMANFHSVFVPKPYSAGTWGVQNGQLTMKINSSWRSDRQNTQATFAVRSISPTDAIIVDSLGRVIRAAKRQ